MLQETWVRFGTNGIGLSDHQNRFSGGVRVGNWVENEYGNQQQVCLLPPPCAALVMQASTPLHRVPNSCLISTPYLLADRRCLIGGVGWDTVCPGCPAVHGHVDRHGRLRGPRGRPTPEAAQGRQCVEH